MKGIVYKIVSPHCEQCYIGSTKNRLCLRKALHLSQFRKYQNTGSGHKTTAFEILEKGDCEFIPIETVEFEHIVDLRKREREIQIEYEKQNKLINVNKAYQSSEERAEEARKKSRLYYLTHTDSQKEFMRKHYYENKADLNEKARLYYHKHKEAIKARLKASKQNKNLCECGIVYTCSKEKHLANNCHKKRMAIISNGNVSKPSKSETGSQAEPINQ